MASSRNKKWNKKQATAEDRRRAELAKIHIAKTERGMTDDEYRYMLHTVAGVTSAADLDAKGRRAVLEHLYGGRVSYPGRPKNMDLPDRKAQMEKIGALLAAGKRPWNYAHALARNICRTKDDAPIDSLGWVPEEQLYKIITALRKQAQREGWDLSGEKR
jgi:phage gp16-like protein